MRQKWPPGPSDGSAGGLIVFVHPSDDHYGADRVLLQILDALPEPYRIRAEFWLPVDLPHDSSPLCSELEQRGATVRHMDLPVLRRAYRRPDAVVPLVGRMWRLYRGLVHARPDMVYLTTSATLLGAPMAWLARVPRVVGHVQEIWSRGDACVLRLVAGWCDQLIAISEVVKSSLPESLQGRTAVVLNVTPEPRSHTSLAGRSGPLKFIVAGRWNSWKGHRTLLTAWDMLDGDDELVVLGGPPPSGDCVDVTALVAELRRPGSVQIVGDVLDPHPFIDEADVMVVPSDNPEPFGLVAIEALARGRPVVGSNAGGLREIVTEGKDGWLFPMGDSEALTDVLRSLSRPLVCAAGHQARLSYKERFTPERYTAGWRHALGLETAGADELTTHLNGHH